MCVFFQQIGQRNTFKKLVDHGIQLIPHGFGLAAGGTAAGGRTLAGAGNGGKTALRQLQNAAYGILGRGTVEAIAADIGESVSDVTRALCAIVEPVSLYETVYSDGGDSIYVMDQIADDSCRDELWLEDIALKEAIKKLGEREKKIINMRFYKGKTQMEIAEEIGISQAQVSRLEKGAFERIRKQI